MNVSVIKYYKGVVVEFSGDCPNRVCKELGLEGMVNCPKRGNSNSVICDYDKLIDFAVAVENGKVKLPADIACQYEICGFGDDCAGTKEERDENFDCNLACLINAVAGRENKAAMAINLPQLFLFELV